MEPFGRNGIVYEISCMATHNIIIFWIKGNWNGVKFKKLRRYIREMEGRKDNFFRRLLLRICTSVKYPKKYSISM